MKKNSEIQESLDDDVNRNVGNIIGFLRSKVGVTLVVGLFFVLILIVVIGSDDTKLGTDTLNTEKKLADIIGKMEGVESATVMITYETSKREAVKTDVNTEISGNTKASSSLNLFPGVYADSKPVTESEPEIKGVIVVAKGADDYMVKLNIINAVTIGLNIPANKVEVLCMK